ncbi:hypothetical protein KCP76_16970 [Salmonella enterica subsp. enterica serovar Weltevreden]|nr:hypothetical protein KCP76_16970 [Salmonella enterica subsp. enterica serovar Weltevreden]
MKTKTSITGSGSRAIALSVSPPQQPHDGARNAGVAENDHFAISRPKMS